MAERTLSRAYEPNPLLRVVYRWFFDNIQVDDAWVRQVRALSGRGTVVYVLRSLNLIDFLALDHLTKRYDLPQVRYANDLRLGPLDPMSKGWLAAVAGHGRAPDVEALREALAEGGSAALFLKRPPGVADIAAGASGGRGLREGDDQLRALIDLQRERVRPILLVPQLFVWTNRPDTQGTHPLDFFLGPREWPSRMRTLGQFLAHYKHVELKAGEALDLKHYLATEADCSDDAHVRRIVYVMLRRLERERRVVTGPAQNPPDRQRHQILRSPKLQGTIAHMAGEKAEDRQALIRRALKMLREMQATPDTPTIKALEVLLDRVFHRIYAGIDVDEAGIQRLRDLNRDGSLVLLPSHKSHVDYLVLSYLFNERNLQLPVIAAGDNLSFFPLGPILRRAGGFFIRRSFRGDKLYSATVEAYVRRLMRDGHTIELFIEGGRSRTGKLLTPKFGLLGMLVDAALNVTSREVHFVPISIGYERIVETGSYEKELSGGEKTKEDAAGLFKSTEVLRHKYGRISVQIGQTLSLRDLRREVGLADDTEPTPPKRRAIVVRLANRAMDEINRVTAVTPGALTALALLSDRTRLLPHHELLVRCARLLEALRSMGARITPRTATRTGTLREESIREAAQMFLDAELLEAHGAEGARAKTAGPGVAYRIPDRKRLELDTAKNHIVHFFVERGLIAIAMLVPPGPPVELAAVRERVRSLSKLFKHEFRFRADASFDQIFDATIAAMQRGGDIAAAEDSVAPGPGRDGWSGEVWLRTYAWTLRSFVEGYRVAARSLGGLRKGPLAEKDAIKRALAVGARMAAAGEVELREAVSKSVIQNAYQAFVDEGYVRTRDGKHELTDSFQSPEALAAIEGRIAGFLRIAGEEPPGNGS